MYQFQIQPINIDAPATNENVAAALAAIYTSAGHTPTQPIERVRVFFNNKSSELTRELIPRRKGRFYSSETMKKIIHTVSNPDRSGSLIERSRCSPAH